MVDFRTTALSNTRYGWHSGKLRAKQIFIDDQSYFFGTLNYGDAVADSLIVKGRIATSTAAGAALTIDATYAYSEGMEYRYAVTAWTGVGSSFSGMYLRAESSTATAAGKSLYGMTLYGTCNNVTHTTGSLWGALIYAYNKGVDAVTINNMYAVQAELTWDASRTGDCTITTEAAVILAKVTGGRVADYTKIHGIIVRFGEMDGDSQLFGSALHIEDDAGMSGTSTFTKGIQLEAGCTTGIAVEGACTTGILVSGACTDGIKITGACSSAQLEISGTDILASGEQAIYINCPGETTATNGIWGTVKSTVATGDISGIRFKAETLRGTSGGPTIRCIRGQAVAATASMFAALLCGGQFEASYAGGTITSTNIYAVNAHISQGAGLQCSGNCVAFNADIQTRGDETIGGHYGLLMTNEAVGGNGLKLDAFIACKETNLGGGMHAADYVIDCGTNTDIIDTAVIRVGDDQTICSDDNQAILVDISGTSNAGFMKVVVGSSTKYIALYDTKTS